MRSNLAAVFGLLTAITGFSLPAAQTARAADATPTLNLFNYPEYIDPALITDFEAQCHCKVVQSYYLSNSELEAKLQNGGDSQYDVVVPASYYIPTFIDEGLIQPIDHAKLSNFDNLMPKFQNPDYDPGDAYSIPYLWGTSGIAYDASKIKNPGDGWGLLFDPKINQTYPFTLPSGDGRDTIGAACAYLGYGFNCQKKSQLLAAVKLIRETRKRPNFVGFDFENPALQKLKSGSIAVTMAFNGDVAGCKTDGSCESLQFYLPREGSEIWVDTMAIPTHAPHPALALAFINFMLNAKNGAQLATYEVYATPNAQAQKQLSGIFTSSLLSPTMSDMQHLSFLAPLRGKSYQLFYQIWPLALQN